MKSTNLLLRFLALTFLMDINISAAIAQPCSEAAVVRTTVLNLTVTSATYLQCDGTSVTFNPTSDNVEITNNAEKWGWDHLTQTLTLGGVNFDITNNVQFGVRIPGNIVVNAATTNKMKFTSNRSDCATLYCRSDAVITGTGILDVEIVSTGTNIASSQVVWFNTKVIIQETTINVYRRDMIDNSGGYDYYDGVYFVDLFELKSGEVNIKIEGATGNAAANKTEGIYGLNGNVVVDGGILSINISDGIKTSRGIRAAQVNFNNGRVGITTGNSIASYAIFTGICNIHGGIGNINAKTKTFSIIPTFASNMGFTSGNQNAVAATWDTIYTVTFNSNGGEGTMVSQRFAQDVSQVLTKNTFTRVGYTFQGWSTTADGTVTYTDQQNMMVPQSMTLYAVWKINTYTITFSVDGDTPAPENQMVDYNTLIPHQDPPSKVNYDFGGWYKDAALTTSWDFNVDKVFVDMTLYAKWIQTVTVTFNPQNGNTTFHQILHVGALLNKPIEPIKNGFTFAGWYIQGTTTLWNFGTAVVTVALTLEPKWVAITVPVHQVTFNLDNGVANSVAHVETGNKVPKPTDPIKSGYTFAGWYKEDLTILWNFDDNVTTDVTLYAKWTRLLTFTVSFETNNGDMINNITTNYGTIDKPIDLTKPNYTFAGWYKEPTFGNAWDFTTNVVTADMTLYAKWTLNMYSVTFNANDGSTVVNASVFYNGLIPQPSDPTKTNFTFRGWYADATFFDSWDFTTERVINNMTLYALWSENRYTISFDVDGGSKVRSISIIHDNPIVAPFQPIKPNYTFGGWYKEVGLTNEWNFATDKVTADITLYAKWNIVNSIAKKDLVLRLYPNPATTGLNIENIDLTNATTVEIFDLLGRLVLQVPATEFVDISKLLQGVYTVKAGNFTSKIIKN